MPKVSVIVPCYMVEKYIAQCLDSLIGQTLQDIEIVCVDDCGTDNTMQIVYEFAQKDKRIKIVSKNKHLGLSEARNIGIKNSNADLIMFCDSDDWYLPQMCEKMYNAIIDNNADFVMCAVKEIYEYGFDTRNFKRDIYKPKRIGVYKNTPGLLHNEFVGPVNKIYKRDIIFNHNVWFPIGLRYEDDFYFPAYTAWADKIVFIPDALYVYRRHPKSITGKSIASAEVNIEPLKIAEAYFNYATENGLMQDKWRYNDFWTYMFVNMLEASLVYSGKQNEKHCFDYAIDFIKNNYRYSMATDYTKRVIKHVKARRLELKRSYGIFNVIITQNKTDFRLCGLSLWKEKYTDKYKKYYLFGVPILFSKY